MAPDAPARDRKAELAAIGPVALARVEVEARAVQPGDGQILERVADGEDAECLAAEVLALVLRRRRELELEGTLAGMAEARAAEIVPGRPRGLIGGERLIDGGVDPLGEAGAAVIVQWVWARFSETVASAISDRNGSRT